MRTAMAAPNCSLYVPAVSIHALYELAISRELTLALRLTPMLDGYTVRIQVAMYQGPCPRFEKHFEADIPIAEAIDAMARYPLDFFKWAEEGSPADESLVAVFDPFLLGWTAPHGTAMCQGVVVARPTKGSRP